MLESGNVGFCSENFLLLISLSVLFVEKPFSHLCTSIPN